MKSETGTHENWTKPSEVRQNSLKVDGTIQNEKKLTEIELPEIRGTVVAR